MHEKHHSTNRIAAQSKVAFYPSGVKLIAPVTIAKGSKTKGGKRGTVKGWSTASRRRLRVFLLEHQLPGWRIYNVTCTIPGLGLLCGDDPAAIDPVPFEGVRYALKEPGHTMGEKRYFPVWERQISEEQEKRIFRTWSDRATKAGWAAVWRLEVQKRGQRHWHMLVGLPPVGAGGAPEGVLPAGTAAPFARHRVMNDGVEELWESWSTALKIIGQVTKVTRFMHAGEVISGWETGDLTVFDGASLHACHVDWCKDGDDNGWMRYLCDHASKAKQEQIAEGKGRHWAVIGKKHFVQVAPEVVALERAEYARVRRWYERLARGQVIDSASPFGRSLGRPVRRGRLGSAVCFCRPDTLRRMEACARSLTVGG